MSSLNDIGKEFAVGIAAMVEQQVSARIRSMIEDAFRQNLKVIYRGDEEAGEFLGVSADAVRSWRQRGLIEYALYPVTRIRKDGDEEKLSDIVTYDAAQLLSFRDRYIIKAVSPSRYELTPRFSVVGPAIEERPQRRAVSAR